MTDLSTTITPPGDTAWVYDPQHEALRFVSQTNGALYTYSLSQQAFTAPLSIGGTPDSIAISPDGRTLVIGNATAVGGGAVVTRVNLDTLAVDQVSSGPGVGGVANIAVDVNGTAIFDVLGGNQFVNNFHAFTAAAVTPAIATAAALALVANAAAGSSSYMLSSPDHRFLLIQDPLTGPSQIFLYDTAFNAVTGHAGNGDVMVKGFQKGSGDVSNNGLVVDVTPEAALVLDQQLHLIKDLRSIVGGVAGAAFSQDGRELFVWVPPAGAVYALDTQTWTVVATLKATLHAGAMGAGNISAHDMQVVGHGNFLALNDGVHVELIDLAARLDLPLGPPAPTADPVVPLPPLGSGPAATIVAVSGDMDAGRLSHLLNATITRADDTAFSAGGPGASSVKLSGYGLGYTNDQLSSGSVQHVDFTDLQSGHTILTFSAGMNFPGGWPAVQFQSWLVNNNTAGAFQTLLAGSDVINGGAGPDVIHGYAGNDNIQGMGGSDAIYGGEGDDLIFASARPQSISTGAAGSTWLRGENGNDYILGGAGFDNMNGNAGRDTLSGGAGDDWVLGGKDDDFLTGDAGGDIINGNLGADTGTGGAGDDFVRGGQGNDLLYGGQGSDWLAGDLGDDTLSGGTGADIFHAGGGIDRAMDFNAAEGDRVGLDPGATFTVHQAGADTVIDLGAGAQMILVGVQMNALPAGWIVTA